MEGLWTTILSVALSAVVSGIVGYLVKKSMDDYFRKKGTQDRQRELQITELEALKAEKLRTQQKADIQEIVKNLVDPIEAKVDKLTEQMLLNTVGTVVLLRDKMKNYLEDCKSQGYASSTDRMVWKELYKAYKELGGNHFRELVDVWKAELEALPAGVDEIELNFK